MRYTAITTLAVLLLMPTMVMAGAAGDVSKGLEQFKAGDYKAAAESFAAAAEANPDEKRIEFDHACALAADGDWEGALEWFRKAALAEDPKLAAKCHYNMGCMDVDRAQELLGEDPAAVETNVRAEVLEMLETAVAHFRNCVATDPEHDDAAYNIEAVRLWTQRMQDVWRRRDLEKQREKMELLAYLKQLEGQQRALRQKGKSLDAEQPSIDRYQRLHDTSKSQRYLSEEIEPLKAKILASLQPQHPPAQTAAPSAPGLPSGAASGAPQVDAQKAAEVLGGLADNAGKAMLAAADSLAAYKPADATAPQAEAVEKIDQVFMAAAPYQQLVQHAIERQTKSADASAQAAAPPAPATEEEPTEAEPIPFDAKDAAWNQRFITGYSGMIQAKARQGLKNMPPPQPEPKAEEQPQPFGPPVDPATAAAAEAEKPKQPDPAEAARKKQEALRKAMQNAVDLGPKLTDLTVAAATDLEENNPTAAIPKQKEAIELLKKMLPEDEQQQDKQDQNQQDQNKDEQNKDDKQNQDQDKKDQDKKDQDKKDQDKKDKGKEDEKKDEKDKKDEDKKDPGKDEEEKDKDKKQDSGGQGQDDKQKQAGKKEEQRKNAAMEQAKATLKKAKQRQDERRKMEKILQRYLYRPEKVEKDW